MTRILFLALLLTAGPTLADTLPEPPMPPAQVPERDAAPTPDRDAKTGLPPPSEHAAVELKVFRATPYDAGVAFTPGSRFRTPEERKPIQTPGVSFSFPLE